VADPRGRGVARMLSSEASSELRQIDWLYSEE
jgi:hypothetical protein